MDEIIEKDDTNEQKSGAQNMLEGQGGPLAGMQYNVDGDDEEEMDIDLTNPDDIQVIEQEFKKLYYSEEAFQRDFG